MKRTDPRRLSLSELAEESGVAERTIRFYIARGLVPGPAGAGRGAAYSGEHLDRLRKIREWQAQGRMLADIARHLGGDARRGLPEPAAWWSYPVGEDVVVMVRAGAGPWRTKQIRAALEEFLARLRQTPGEKEGEDEQRQ